MLLNKDNKNFSDKLDNNDRGDLIYDLSRKKSNGEINISNIFSYKKAEAVDMGKKNDTKDIKKGKLKDLNFYKKQKLKIIKNKQPFNKDINNKLNNNGYLSINNYEPKEDENTLNIINIDAANKKSGPYGDIHIQPKTFFGKINSFIKSYYFLISIIFIVFFIFPFFYFVILRFQIEKTYHNVEKIFSYDFFNLNNYKNFEKNFYNVRTNINILNILFKPIDFVNFFVSNKNGENYSNIIKFSKYFSDFGFNFIKIADNTKNLIKEKGISQVEFSNYIDNSLFVLKQMKKSLDNGENYLQKIRDTNLGAIDSKVEILNDNFLNIQSKYEVFYNNIETIKSILGHYGKRKYMILFQNNDELRPIGGFISTIGILEIEKGKITNFEKMDALDLEKKYKSLFGIFEISPEGLNRLTNEYRFRDINYYLRLKNSSKKIKLYTDKLGMNLDGLIYINYNILKKLLKNNKEFDFNNLKKNINKNNFSTIFSLLTESTSYKKNASDSSKKIFFDFIDFLIDDFKKTENYNDIIRILRNSIHEKEMQFFSYKENENNFITDIGLVKQYDYKNMFDFNYPVFLSISNNKSDRYMKRTFVKNYDNGEKCGTIKTSFTIKQENMFNSENENNIKEVIKEFDLTKNTDMKEIIRAEGKDENKQFIRVLVPKKSIVEKDKNIRIVERVNYKEIFLYLNTNVGGKSEFTINYSLPNKDCDDYTYSFIKQPGIYKYDLSVLNNGKNIRNLENLKTDYNF